MNKNLTIYGNYTNPKELWNQNTTDEEPTSIDVHCAQKLIELYSNQISVKSYLQNIGIAANLIHAIDARLPLIEAPNKHIFK